MKWIKMKGWQKTEHEGYIIQLKKHEHKYPPNPWSWDISYDVGSRLGINNLAIASSSRTEKMAKADILAWFSSDHRKDVEIDKPKWVKIHKLQNKVLDEMKAKNIRIKLK